MIRRWRKFDRIREVDYMSCLSGLADRLTMSSLQCLDVDVEESWLHNRRPLQLGPTYNPVGQ